MADGGVYGEGYDVGVGIFAGKGSGIRRRREEKVGLELGLGWGLKGERGGRGGEVSVTECYCWRHVGLQ